MGSAVEVRLEAVFAVSLSLVLLSVFIVVLRFNDSKHNSKFSVFLILLGVISSLGLVAIFPTDFGAALGEDSGNVDKSTFDPILKPLYRLFYWSAMVLNYLFLPSMEMIIRSGGIGLAQKLSDVSIQILKLIAAIIFVSIIFTIIFLAAENEWDGSILVSLETTLIGISNTLGLVQITVFLGYGLIELPRYLWRTADPEAALKFQKMVVIREYRARDDARTKLQLALDDVYRFQQLVNDTLDRKKREKLAMSLQVVISEQYKEWNDDEHRRAKNRALAKPDEFMTVSDMSSIHKQNKKSAGQLRQEPISLADLMLFRGKVGDWVRAHIIAEGRVLNCEYTIWYLEDIIAAKTKWFDDKKNIEYQKAYQKSHGDEVMHKDDGDEYSQSSKQLKWWDGTESNQYGKIWHILIRPFCKKMFAIIFILSSALLVFIEFDALLVASTPNGSGGVQFDENTFKPSSSALLLGFMLGYVCYVLAWTSSQLSGSRECLVVAGGKTSALALSYYARTALGMAASLIFYALSLLFPHLHVHGNGIGSETAFYRVYGNRIIDSKIANKFSVYFPAVLLILVALQSCGVFAKLLDKLGCGWLVFETLGKIDDMELQRGENRLTTRKSQVLRHVQHELRLKHVNGTDSISASTAGSLLVSAASRGVSLQGVTAPELDLEQQDDERDKEYEDLNKLGSRIQYDSHQESRLGEDDYHEPLLNKPKKEAKNKNTWGFGSSDTAKGDASINRSTIDDNRGTIDRSTLDASHSSMRVSNYAPPQQEVVKKVATCKRCGEILPRDMDAIEKHEENCIGFNDTSVDSANIAAESQIIENAFVCPQCFAEFESQLQVLDHFPNCKGAGVEPSPSAASSSLLPAATNTQGKDSENGKNKQRRTSLTNLMFGGGDTESKNVSIDSTGSGGPHLSVDSTASSDDGGDDGAVAALNHVIGGGSANTLPGMDLAGWVEKHNKVKGWQRRWFIFNSDMGRLQYYRYSGPSEFTGKPESELLELKGVIDIRYVDIGHKEGMFRRINIEAGARQYKLKVQSEAEGKHWCEQLQVWKDHLTM